MQERRNSIANAVGLHLSCTNPSIWLLWFDPGWYTIHSKLHTVYPKKYAHGFVVLCFVVVMQSFIMNSHEVFIHIHQGCFAGTGAIVRLPQCQWSKPDGYGKISQCITTTKHSKAKTVCIFLGIYCTFKTPALTSPWILRWLSLGSLPLVVARMGTFVANQKPDVAG